ncbi:3-deoxy-manno-octulosonate cytidylyltransferase [Pseudoxanthomonas sangjuensis]|uniref:3-deoxy-manno-octulosonate cytidylyltransferase family protein n=1 Tax=Pseudoxanthomonas sangjuensis TaxID=1503750 RepID=UPI0013908C66|nr:manno-octulosonate cytidylyltransferase [Pseudoxanthomonas sangjuensis]KAF1708765.1 3-deoxy-manno-octulosonate cytidylyltransferase [Pseudoxanthomonas sangjuensis]
MTDFIVAIPARYASTRLPGKPLAPLGGKPLVLRVAERALAAGAREVWVATDDARIAGALQGTAAKVAMTASTHLSGSDRLAECARIAGWGDDAIVVNLQGDEPFAPAEGIRKVAETLADSGADMATLATPITEPEQFFDPNTVKLVCKGGGDAGLPGDRGGLRELAGRDPEAVRRLAHGFDGWRDALYFSRAPIPWHRDAFAQDRRVLMPGTSFRHIGIYAYRAGFLRRFAAMPPGQLEQIESLEQLRALEAGFRIAVALTPAEFPPGVDTPDDLARAEAWLRGHGG